MFHQYQTAAGPLQVSFASRNRPPGRFERYGCEDARHLLLNCPNTWYIEGVPGLAPCPETLAEQLSGAALAIGSSMGGFGAVMIGSLAKVERVVAFGAEIVTNLPGGYSHEGVRAASPYARLTDLLEDEVHYTLIAGEHSPVDVHGLSTVADRPNVNAIVIPGAGHAVVAELKAAGRLDDLVARFQAGDDVGLPTVGTSRYGVSPADLIDAAHEHAMDAKDPRQLAVYLRRARSWSALADVYRRKDVQFNDAERAEILALTAIKMGDAESAIHHASALSGLSPTPIAWALLSDAYAQKRQPSMALEYAKKAVHSARAAGLTQTGRRPYDERLRKLTASYG